MSTNQSIGRAFPTLVLKEDLPQAPQSIATNHGRNWSIRSAASSLKNMINPRAVVPSLFCYALSKLPFAQARTKMFCAKSGFSIPVHNHNIFFRLYVDYIAKTPTSRVQRDACCDEIEPTLEQITNFLNTTCVKDLTYIPNYVRVTKYFDMDNLTELTLSVESSSTYILSCIRNGFSNGINRGEIQEILKSFWIPCMDKKIEDSEFEIRFYSICVTAALVGILAGGYFASKKWSSRDVEELDIHEIRVAFPPGILELEREEDEMEDSRPEPQERELQVLNQPSIDEETEV